MFSSTPAPWDGETAQGWFVPLLVALLDTPDAAFPRPEPEAQGGPGTAHSAHSTRAWRVGALGPGCIGVLERRGGQGGRYLRFETRGSGLGSRSSPLGARSPELEARHSEPGARSSEIGAQSSPRRPCIPLERVTSARFFKGSERRPRIRSLEPPTVRSPQVGCSDRWFTRRHAGGCSSVPAYD